MEKNKMKQIILNSVYKLDEKICKAKNKKEILDLISEFITNLEKMYEN